MPAGSAVLRAETERLFSGKRAGLRIRNAAPGKGAAKREERTRCKGEYECGMN